MPSYRQASVRENLADHHRLESPAYWHASIDAAPLIRQSQNTCHHLKSDVVGTVYARESDACVQYVGKLPGASPFASGQRLQNPFAPIGPPRKYALFAHPMRFRSVAIAVTQFG